MTKLKKQIFLDCGKYPSIIINENYQNSGMCLIQQLRFKDQYFVAYKDDLLPIGEWTNNRIKK